LPSDVIPVAGYAAEEAIVGPLGRFSRLGPGSVECLMRQGIQAGLTVSVRAMAMTSALPTRPELMAWIRPTASRWPSASSPNACTCRIRLMLLLADLEADEPCHGDAGLVEQRLDRLLAVRHRWLFEQHDIFEEPAQPALDDLGQRLLGFAFRA
jgi:hypothetical protein